LPAHAVASSGEASATVMARTVLTAADLVGGSATGTVPSSAFAAPDDAAPPVHEIEGTLTIQGTAASGGFTALKDPHGYASIGAVKELPDVSVALVQNDDVLVPAERGLRITGSTAWNVAFGLGRAWQEDGDDGMTRA